MASKKAEAPTATSERQTEAVESFLSNLDHPFIHEVRALRQIIIGADARVREEVKWNAPSFYSTEHFATFNLHPKDHVQLVLHRGAKVREDVTERLPISDPTGLLEWRSKDRAIARFNDMSAVNAKHAALEAVVREWIEHV